MIIKRKQARDAQCNCSTPADQCQTPLPQSRSATLLGNSPQPIHRTWHLWYGISLWLIQITCPSYDPSSSFCIALHWQSMRKEGKINLWCRVNKTYQETEQQCVINTFLITIQNTALEELLRRNNSILAENQDIKFQVKIEQEKEELSCIM